MRPTDVIAGFNRLPLSAAAASFSAKPSEIEREVLELFEEFRNPLLRYSLSFGGTWNVHVKDDLEEGLHQLVCGGKLNLSSAQRDIATDWIAAYKNYFNTDKPLSLRSDRIWFFPTPDRLWHRLALINRLYEFSCIN
jgi:hypothetical protein